jgi:hypothetical protein
MATEAAISAGHKPAYLLVLCIPQLVLEEWILLHYSKMAKPHPVALRGSSKEFSHHGAQ